jgi:autotransporter-associated beta strand protein
MTVNGGNNNIVTDNTNGGNTLTINGDLVINQPATGVMTPFALTNRTTGSNAKQAIIRLNGATSSLTFNGNASNTQSAVITSLAEFGASTNNNQIVLTQANHNFTVTDGGADVDLIIQPIITQTAGGKGITKLGAGTLELQGELFYTGATVVNAGRLIVNKPILGTVTTNGGTLVANASIGGQVTVNGGARVIAAGPVNALTINSGGTFVPGSAVQEFDMGADSSDVVLNGGGIIELQLGDTPGSGTAGVDWDLLNAGGAFDLQGLSSGNRFVLKLQTVDGTGNPSLLDNFDPSTTYEWLIATTAFGMFVPGGGFNSNLFTVDTAGFANSFSGAFSIIPDNVADPLELRLHYEAIPEPSVLALLAGSVLLMAIVRRREVRKLG